ncbi:MAG: FmdE family protein [Armatimonadota bacterium]
MTETEKALFDEVARFHGHVCPGLVSGFRVALAALERIGSRRSEDEEVVAVVENDSCAVDAIQVVLGCTFGKGNLVFLDYGKPVYTFYQRDRRGPALRIRVKRPQLPEGLSRDEVVQALLELDESKLLVVTQVEAPPPRPARIEPSQACAQCGEDTMESRLRLYQGRLLCLPCWYEARGEPK